MNLCPGGGEVVFTWWGSVGVRVLVLGLLQGSQQLFDLIGEVRLLDQVLGGLVTLGTLEGTHTGIMRTRPGSSTGMFYLAVS